jgi:hypothetical protein
VRTNTRTRASRQTYTLIPSHNSTVVPVHPSPVCIELVHTDVASWHVRTFYYSSSDHIKALIGTSRLVTCITLVTVPFNAPHSRVIIVSHAHSPTCDISSVNMDNLGSHMHHVP